MIAEGGNVFKDPQGAPLTQRINQQDVPATVAWLERVTGLRFPQDRWLGSTGKTPTSGDLDLAVDTGEISKDELAQRITQFLTQHGQDPRTWIKKSGEVHFRTPIAGRADRGFVQTDFMFFPNVDWGSFYYAGGEDSAYKGMTRNVLMSSLAKQQGLKIGANGVISRMTNEVVTLDPDRAATLLLGPGKTRRDLRNVETIYANLAQDPDRDAKLQDFRDYLSREGLQEPTVIAETDVNFLSRLRDRIVNQGMVPIMEDRNPRIPYIEDLVFQKGIAGVRDALAIINDTAQNTRQYATQKWDGCVHPDTKVLTSQGIMRIEDLIDHVNQSQSLTVLAHNFALFADEQVNVSDAIKKYGIKEWVEIVFESGETIKLTKDHPVFTNNRGWVLAEDLTNDDDVKHVKCD